MDAKLLENSKGLAQHVPSREEREENALAMVNAAVYSATGVGPDDFCADTARRLHQLESEESLWTRIKRYFRRTART